MKKTISIFTFILLACIAVQAQEDIFKKHGVTKEPLTLSKGKYKETFTNKEIMQIGTVLINTRTEKIVEFLEVDTAKLTYKAETTSRFLTVDPLAEKHYNWSPYVYVLNNPLRYTDPDGRIERDKTGNIKFHSSGNVVSRAPVSYNGYTYTANYNSGYVKTDLGNKVSAEKLVSVTVMKGGEKIGDFPAAHMAKLGDFDFSSNCFGLAMADGQVYINDPQTVLNDEYTKVGSEKGATMDNVANTNHDIVTVGIDALDNISHAAKTDGKGTYTHKDDNKKIKTNEPIGNVVNFYGSGEVSGLPVKELDIHIYKKNQ